MPAHPVSARQAKDTEKKDSDKKQTNFFGKVAGLFRSVRRPARRAAGLRHARGEARTHQSLLHSPIPEPASHLA